MDRDCLQETHAPAGRPAHVRLRAAGKALLLTLLAFAISVLCLVAVLHGDWMTPAFAHVARLVADRPAWAVAAASSPLWAALLIGYGYMQRAIRRRGAEAEAARKAQPLPPDPP